MQDEAKQYEKNPPAHPGLPAIPETRGRAGLIEKVALFYSKSLTSAQKARAWLKRRQLDDETLQHFQIGYASGRLLKTLPSEGEEPRKSLQNLGILTPGGEEFFLHCVTAPLLDGDGGIVAMAGIPVTGGDDLLLANSPTAIWNAPAAKLYSELLITTSLVDGLSLHKAGFPHACAVIGKHLKPMDLNLLHDAGVRRIILLGARSSATLLLEQMAGFSTDFHELAVNDFLVDKGSPELVAEVDRIRTRPASNTGDGRIEAIDQGFAVSFGRRRYEVLGIEKNARRLKITIKTERFGKLHVDTLDLYHAKSRKTLLQDLCVECRIGVVILATLLP